MWEEDIPGHVQKADAHWSAIEAELKRSARVSVGLGVGLAILQDFDHFSHRHMGDAFRQPFLAAGMLHILDPKLVLFAIAIPNTAMRTVGGQHCAPLPVRIIERGGRVVPDHVESRRHVRPVRCSLGSLSVRQVHHP